MAGQKKAIDRGKKFNSRSKFVWPAKNNNNQGSKLKKSSGRLLATNWRNIITRCKFLVASLYNVNDAAHSLVRSIGFDWLKISRTEVGLNLEVNWLCLCNLAHFLEQKQRKIR